MTRLFLLRPLYYFSMKAFICLLAVGFLSACTQNKTGSKDAVPSADTSRPMPAIADHAVTYKTYCNSRYGFCIAYPGEILYPQGESGSGDGEAFKSKDGGNTLLAYRDFRDNIDPDKPFAIATAYAQDLKPDEGDPLKKNITYKKLGKDFYVISGFHDDKVFYQKTMMADSQLVTCILEYRQSDRALYDQVSEQVFKSFK